MSQKNNTKKDLNHSLGKSERAKKEKQFVIKRFCPGAHGATFYIQSHGLHAGRPLRTPILNSWAVYCTVPKLYQIAFSIYKSRQLQPLIRGSVIPFIRLKDYRPILGQAAQQSSSYDATHLQTLELIEAHIENLGQQRSKLRQLQEALAYKLNQEITLKTSSS